MKKETKAKKRVVVKDLSAKMAPTYNALVSLIESLVMSRALRSIVPCLCLAAVQCAAYAMDGASWSTQTIESSPWVYNWWMGSAVDAGGLESQCREMDYGLLGPVTYRDR